MTEIYKASVVPRYSGEGHTYDLGYFKTYKEAENRAKLYLSVHILVNKNKYHPKVQGYTLGEEINYG